MTQKTYAELAAEHDRRAILALLSADADYAAPTPLIKVALHQTGTNLSTARLDTELMWLEEQGLVTLVRGGILVAKLTERGNDVVSGAARVPGVAPPAL